MRVEQDLSLAHIRLARVYIENMHYEKMITRTDKEHTLFYVDPPYHGCENYYGDGIFNRKDFESLRDILWSIKGKFIMSINNTAEIRKLYKAFHLEEVKTTYSAGGGNKSQKVTELLIMNYSPN